MNIDEYNLNNETEIDKKNKKNILTITLTIVLVTLLLGILLVLYDNKEYAKENKDSETKTIEVVDGTSVSRTIDVTKELVDSNSDYTTVYINYGEITLSENIVLPKVNLTEASTFNKKILNDFKDYTDNEYFYNNITISYEYKILNNIVFILIKENSSKDKMYGYYYDLENNIEISLDKVMNKLGLSKENINAGFNNCDYKDKSFEDTTFLEYLVYSYSKDDLSIIPTDDNNYVSYVNYENAYFSFTFNNIDKDSLTYVIDTFNEERSVEITPIVASSSVNYQKVYDLAGSITVRQSIILPKILIDNKNATELNDTILSRYNGYISYFNSSEVTSDIELSYTYKVYNDIIFINIKLKYNGYPGTYVEAMGYYYDVSSNKVLTVEELLSKLNLSIDSIKEAFNNTEYASKYESSILDSYLTNNTLAIYPNEDDTYKISIYISDNEYIEFQI